MIDVQVHIEDAEVQERLQILAERRGISVEEQARQLLLAAVRSERLPAARPGMTLWDAVLEWRKGLPEDWEGFDLPDRNDPWRFDSELVEADNLPADEKDQVLEPAAK